MSGLITGKNNMFATSPDGELDIVLGQGGINSLHGSRPFDEYPLSPCTQIPDIPTKGSLGALKWLILTSWANRSAAGGGL